MRRWGFAPFCAACPAHHAVVASLARTLGFMNTLRASCCILEPQVEAHATEMFEVLSDPAIYEFERVPPPSVRLAAGYRLLEARTSLDGREHWLNWVVRLPNQELAGYVQATVMESGASYIAYEFASRYWRQGVGSASVAAMLEELAISYKVHTFVAVLKRENYRSMGLLRRIGFEHAMPQDAQRYDAEQDELVMIKHAPIQTNYANSAAP